MEYSDVNSKEFILKFLYNSLTKRSRTIPRTFKELNTLIVTSFPVLAGQPYEISYTDPDGDKIVVSDENDWQEAIHCGKEANSALKLAIDSSKASKKAPKYSQKLGEIIEQLVKEEAQKLSGVIREMILKEIEKNYNGQKAIHRNVVCDFCNMNPLCGVRYKCTECPDYDLCETCEAQGIHNHHLFLKISEPRQAPVSIITQPGISHYSTIDAKSIEEGFKQLGIQLGQSWKEPKLKPFYFKKGKKNMGIVDNSIIELSGAIDEIVHAQWIVRNKSEIAWPSSLYIDKKEGDIEFERILISDKIDPKQKEMVINVAIKMPKSTGKHKVVLIMHDSEGVWIGEKLKLHLNTFSKELKSEMTNTNYFKASQLSNQGYGTFDECLIALQRVNGDIIAAKNFLNRQQI